MQPLISRPISHKTWYIVHSKTVFGWVLGFVVLALLPILMSGCKSPQTAEKLAFTSVQGDAAFLYVVQVDGSRLRKISDTVTWHISTKKWSPDGHRLAFISEYQGLPNLYVTKESSEFPQRLTTEKVGYFAWSPDGNEIVL